jgi:uncharacterized protein (DUF302 family)
MTRLLAAIDARGLTVFATIDHADAARSVGLELAEERVVVFGSPQSGTPLMRSDPRIGIELPLRILVWEDGDVALLGYHDPRELSRRYDVVAHQPTLEHMATLLAGLVAEAVG